MAQSRVAGRGLGGNKHVGIGALFSSWLRYDADAKASPWTRKTRKKKKLTRLCQSRRLEEFGHARSKQVKRDWSVPVT